MGFQVFLALVALMVSSTHAGTRAALPGEEARALSLWDKYCAGDKDGGTEGNLFIHCKHPLEQLRKTLSTSIQAQVPKSEQREQIIFVSPPKLHFDHQLEIRGGAALEPKTIVYVKPAKTSHTYEADLQIPENEHKKPELVFLSSGGSANKGVGVEIAEESAPYPTVVESKPVIKKRETEDKDHEPILFSRAYSSVVAVTSSRKRKE